MNSRYSGTQIQDAEALAEKLSAMTAGMPEEQQAQLVTMANCFIAGFEAGSKR